MLRRVPAYQEIPAAEILFEREPTCAGARLGAGTTMARAADRVAAAPHLVKYRSLSKYPGSRGSFRRSSGHIDARREVFVGSAGPQEEEGARERCFGSFVLSSSLGYFLEGARVALGPRESARSEERRVGKECRSRWSPYH